MIFIKLSNDCRRESLKQFLLHFLRLDRENKNADDMKMSITTGRDIHEKIQWLECRMLST